MQQKRFARSLLFVLWLALVLAVVPTQAMPVVGQSPTPDGLSAADWIDIQSFLPSDFVKASNTGGSDEFGTAVAVSGDTVVVGAHMADSNTTGVNGDQADNSAGDSGADSLFTPIAAPPALVSSDWGTETLYEIATGTGSATIVGAFGVLDIQGLAYDRNTDTLYGISVNTDSLYTIDQGTGVATLVGAMGVNFPNTAGADFDPNTNTLYASTDGAGTTAGLYKINTSTGAATFVGAFPVNMPGLAFDPNCNTLYGTSGQVDRLYTINTSTGALTEIGPLGINIARNGLAFNPDTATLYLVDELTDQLHTVNSSTGAATSVGPLGTPTMAGLTYLDPSTSCIQSAESGYWGDTSTWVGGSVPGVADAVCVNSNHTITLAGGAAADSLVVLAGGVLDLSTHAFTVERCVSNEGTLRQTQTVDGTGAVNFLQIHNIANSIDHYRGVDIAAGVNLGQTVVEVQGNTAVCNTNNGGAYRNRCFMVNPTNAGTVDITLHTTRSEDDLTDDAFFQHASGTTWTQGASCSDGAGVGGTCTGSATFASPAWFLVGSAGNDPTAVTLSNLSTSPASPWLWLVSGLALLGGTAAILRRRRVA